MVNVQTYGGGLWHTWFDRDLNLAGRVVVRAADGSFSHKLVKIKRPLLRVPTLAIHLDRSVVLSKESHTIFLLILAKFRVDILLIKTVLNAYTIHFLLVVIEFLCLV